MSQGAGIYLRDHADLRPLFNADDRTLHTIPTLERRIAALDTFDLSTKCPRSSVQQKEAAEAALLRLILAAKPKLSDLFESVGVRLRLASNQSQATVDNFA